jgi:tRNA pseudouridine13 synthase
LSQIPDWARAWGDPLFAGRIRISPEDFVVFEQIEIEFSGEGEHDWLLIEKTGANTAWVAGQLAKHARIPERDVGYAGLKDRHAVTTQWFSVKREIRNPTDWSAFDAAGIRILDTQVHGRKLKRGMHRGNSFRIAVHAENIGDLRTEIEARLALIANGGVPNYFGEQRFGRGGRNIELGRAVLEGKRLPRNKRSIGISALRSLEFNKTLDTRVRDGTWNRLLPGDRANLDRTGSHFDAEEMTPELDQRCKELDIHPTGVLPAFESIRVDASDRPLRMRVADLEWEIEDELLRLEFTLGKGSYATAMLREIAILS